ncbi:polyadenylate-binding protein-interacting protein 2B isoform X2 [Prionailurus iriomotensis]
MKVKIIDLERQLDREDSYEGIDSIIMNGSSVANTSPNVKSKEDQGLNGHDEKENPFAEYMWMENEEDFNRQKGLITRKVGQKLGVGFDLISTIQVEEELQEQDFLDRCFQEMLDEEDQDWFIPSRDLPPAMGQLQQQLNGLSVSDGHDSEDILSKSNLNPDAKEFIPGVKY